jgi:GNAT superfamily N-acetyltransferase
MKVSMGLLEEKDLAAADRIFRLAFGTFTGHPQPEKFGGDIDKISTRWLADPAAAFGAKVDGELVASIFVTHWGSVGYFGPLTVRPDFWDMGIAQKLLEPTMDLFAQWQTRHAGLYTFAHSPKHLALYQKYGFWPRFLTAIMTKTAGPRKTRAPVSYYSEASEAERAGLLANIREVTDALYRGLDVSREVLAVYNQGLGDTLVIGDDSRVVGFAVCHGGPGSEAGSNAGFIKFGAVRPDPNAEQFFTYLIEACEAWAGGRGLFSLIAGTSLGRQEAYRIMRAQGFRTQVLGVTMHRPNESAYHHPGLLVIDDWR